MENTEIHTDNNIVEKKKTQHSFYLYSEDNKLLVEYILRTGISKTNLIRKAIKEFISK